jgi:hypothetical protein
MRDEIRELLEMLMQPQVFWLIVYISTTTICNLKYSSFGLGYYWSCRLGKMNTSSVTIVPLSSGFFSNP